MTLTLKHIKKSYSTARGELTVLHDCTLQVSAGEFVAIHGKSGCGKSSLLLVAGGLMQPDAGSVNVGDTSLYELNREQRVLFRASHIGFVFQEFHLIPYLNVRDNILAAAVRGRGRSSEVIQRAHDLMAEFGLTQRADHLPQSLSTGERQRTALARALLNKPQVILADEPTGNLDADNTTTVLQHLAEFANQGGIVLLVTHDQRCSDYAHKTYRIDHGVLTSSD